MTTLMGTLWEKLRMSFQTTGFLGALCSDKPEYKFKWLPPINGEFTRQEWGCLTKKCLVASLFSCSTSEMG
jgi:hypothetical protein